MEVVNKTSVVCGVVERGELRCLSAFTSVLHRSGSWPHTLQAPPRLSPTPATLVRSFELLVPHAFTLRQAGARHF